MTVSKDETTTDERFPRLKHGLTWHAAAAPCSERLLGHAGAAMRVVCTQALRAAALVPRADSPRSFAAPARFAATASAPRALFPAPAFRTRTPLTPALRRGAHADAKALTMAPSKRPAHLRPSGIALASVAGLGAIAAGAFARAARAAPGAACDALADGARWWLAPRAAASAAAVTLLGSLVLAALAVLDARLAAAAPEVIVGAGPRTRARLDAAPSLTAPYRPFPGLRHRHAVRAARMPWAVSEVLCSPICARAVHHLAGVFPLHPGGVLLARVPAHGRRRPRHV